MDRLDEWLAKLDKGFGVGRIPGPTTGETPPIVAQSFRRMVDGWDDLREDKGEPEQGQTYNWQIDGFVADARDMRKHIANRLKVKDGKRLTIESTPMTRKSRGFVDSMKGYELTPKRATFKATKFGTWELEYGTEVGKGTGKTEEQAQWFAAQIAEGHNAMLEDLKSMRNFLHGTTYDSAHVDECDEPVKSGNIDIQFTADDKTISEWLQRFAPVAKLCEPPQESDIQFTFI